MALYRPDCFRVDDPAQLCALAQANPFATVISHGDGGVQVSHLPLLVEPTVEPQVESGAGLRLRGHLARDNDQLAHFAKGAEAVAVFHGPHGYVSPSVYEGQRGVPTWNYVVVHLRGRTRLLDAAGLVQVLRDSAVRFDTSGWQPRFGEDWPEVPTGMLEAIVAFEIDVTQAEGKWKLSQNRSESDRQSVAAWLEKGDAASQQVAAMMRALVP